VRPWSARPPSAGGRRRLGLRQAYAGARWRRGAAALPGRVPRPGPSWPCCARGGAWTCLTSESPGVSSCARCLGVRRPRVPGATMDRGN